MPVTGVVARGRLVLAEGGVRGEDTRPPAEAGVGVRAGGRAGASATLMPLPRARSSTFLGCLGGGGPGGDKGVLCVTHQALLGTRVLPGLTQCILKTLSKSQTPKSAEDASPKDQSQPDGHWQRLAAAGTG